VKYLSTDAWQRQVLRPWESVLPTSATRQVEKVDLVNAKHYKQNDYAISRNVAGRIAEVENQQIIAVQRSAGIRFFKSEEK
jgi:hypothetical protein